MRLLLDAHALLWWLADDPALDPAAREAIADAANEVVVSAATVWEIPIKRALGKVGAPDGLADAIERSGFIEAPVTAADAELAAGLDPHHRDPFDRMLVAPGFAPARGRGHARSGVRRYGVETVPA